MKGLLFAPCAKRFENDRLLVIYPASCRRSIYFVSYHPVITAETKPVNCLLLLCSFFAATALDHFLQQESVGLLLDEASSPRQASSTCLSSVFFSDSLVRALLGECWLIYMGRGREIDREKVPSQFSD